MHLKNRQFWPIQVSNSSSIMNSEIVTLAQAIASSETQGRLAGARGNKSDKEMKRHRFTSKAEKAPFSRLSTCHVVGLFNVELLRCQVPLSSYQNVGLISSRNFGYRIEHSSLFVVHLRRTLTRLLRNKNGALAPVPEKPIKLSPD